MNLITLWSITLNLTNQKPIVMVGLNHLFMKTLKQIIKFFFVFIAPLTAMIFYLHNINEIFSLQLSYIILWHIGILFIYFNAIFYSFHMSNTKVFNRFTVTIVPAFGLLVGHHDSGSIQLLIGCVAIEFNYNGLFRKQKPRFNLKKENKF